MYTRNSNPGPPSFRMGGLTDPPPRDVVVLLAVVFATFTVSQFFPLLSALLGLTPLVWQRGFLWQVVTYAFCGFGPPSLWFLFELLILYMFGKDVFRQLGRRHFWRLLVAGSLAAGVAAVLVQMALGLSANAAFLAPFHLMQGQRMLAVILIAAFATMNRQATILFMFVFPMPAGWFLWIEILIAFMLFLEPPRDLAGFVGVCVGVGVTYLYLTRRWMRSGPRDARLQLQRWWLQRRMNRLRRKSGLKAVPGGDVRRGPWSDKVH